LELKSLRLPFPIATQCAWIKAPNQFLADLGALGSTCMRRLPHLVVAQANPREGGYRICPIVLVAAQYLGRFFEKPQISDYAQEIGEVGSVNCSARETRHNETYSSNPQKKKEKI